MSKSETTAALEAELEHRKAMNDKLMRLLLRMEQMFPDDRGRVRPLISRTEAAARVLQDCSEMLENLR